MKDINPPKGYTLVETDDGSFTFHSENYDENCHSTAGALGETRNYFVQGCDIAAKLQHHQSLRVLEVGFGVGHGYLETFKELANSQYPVHFLSTEIDEKLVQWFFSYYQLSFQKIENLYTSKNKNVTLQIIIGDATTSLPSYLQQNSLHFDCIFQDAFSPKKNPELWSEQWFSLLREYSEEDVILATYSASHSVRESLKDAGWFPQKIAGFGHKRAATLAYLKEQH